MSDVSGQWTVDGGQWTVDSGQWTVFEMQGVEINRKSVCTYVQFPSSNEEGTG
jgi:hypothetical protein